jgi:hypothetical protein
MLHQCAILCNNLLQIIFVWTKLHHSNQSVEVAQHRKAHEDPNNPNNPAAGISGSVCVNHLWPVVAGGGVMTVRIITDSNGRKHITNEPLLHQPAPVQSCYCPNCEVMGKELAALKAQPAPVQEPVAMPENWFAGMPEEYRKEAWRVTTPPAQPAVPDAFGTREGEHPQYIEGWNDCRAEMLKGMKP